MILYQKASLHGRSDKAGVEVRSSGVYGRYLARTECVRKWGWGGDTGSPSWKETSKCVMCLILVVNTTGSPSLLQCWKKLWF